MKKFTPNTNIQGCGIRSMDADDQIPRLDMLDYSTDAFTPAFIVHSLMRRARVKSSKSNSTNCGIVYCTLVTAGFYTPLGKALFPNYQPKSPLP